MSVHAGHFLPFFEIGSSIDMKAKTFREAYDVLQGHAQTLRNQSEPNIDDLLTIVNESVAAYRVCKERIDAVEKALEEALVNADLQEATGPNNPSGADAATENRQAGSQPSASDIDDPDVDIPF